MISEGVPCPCRAGDYRFAEVFALAGFRAADVLLAEFAVAGFAVEGFFDGAAFDAGGLFGAAFDVDAGLAAAVLDAGFDAAGRRRADVDRRTDRFHPTALSARKAAGILRTLSSTTDSTAASARSARVICSRC